jgi:hypothetical protein
MQARPRADESEKKEHSSRRAQQDGVRYIPGAIGIQDRPSEGRHDRGRHQGKDEKQHRDEDSWVHDLGH